MSKHAKKAKLKDVKLGMTEPEDGADRSSHGDDALTSFFYVLMRDLVPVGQVAAKIEEMEQSDARRFDLSNPQVADYSRECVERLRRITYG